MKNRRSAQDDVQDADVKRRRRAERSGERINIDVEQEEQYNKYYYKVSKRYRALKFVSLGLLFVYLIGMMATHRSSITYENLVYLMKDLDTDVDAARPLFSEIKYDESSKMSAAMFKGKLALATTGSLTLYNTTGVAEREFEITMENPKVLAGDKYVMVYDVGGNSYSLYTTIIGVLSKQTEYPIQGAALSKSGSFSLITRSKENRYVVENYDENFKKISNNYIDKYVMDVSLSGDGEKYAVVSCDVEGASVSCCVMSGRVDSATASETVLPGAMPLSVRHFKGGNFCVVCDNMVAFFDPDGGKIAEISNKGYSLAGVSFTDSSVMIVEGVDLVGTRNTATVFNSSGETVFSHTVESRVSSYALGDEALFIASEGTLSKITFDGEKEEVSCPLSVSSLVPYSDNVLVMGETSAVTAFTENVNEEEK